MRGNTPWNGKPLPNYSLHATEFMIELGEMMRQQGINPDTEVFLADLLKRAVKFILPDNGCLFEERDFKPSFFDMLNLPYPVCALEFAANDLLYGADSNLLRAPKRIALCFDLHALPAHLCAQLERLTQVPEFYQELPERAMGITAVFEAEGVWGAAGGLLVLDLDHDQPIVCDSDEGARLREAVGTRAVERIGTSRTRYGLPLAFYVFPGRARLIGQTHDEAVENLYIDCADEVVATYQFLAAINCSNVATQRIEAPKMLNAKRLKKGKLPMYDYHYLDIAIASDKREPGTGNGTHASPRAHLRRGHIRRLGERFGNKTLWINATMVNAAGAMPEAKTYRVKP